MKVKDKGRKAEKTIFSERVIIHNPLCDVSDYYNPKVVRLVKFDRPDPEVNIGGYFEGQFKVPISDLVYIGKDKSNKRQYVNTKYEVPGSKVARFLRHSAPPWTPLHPYL